MPAHPNCPHCGPRGDTCCLCGESCCPAGKSYDSGGQGWRLANQARQSYCFRGPEKHTSGTSFLGIFFEKVFAGRNHHSTTTATLHASMNGNTYPSEHTDLNVAIFTRTCSVPWSQPLRAQWLVNRARSILFVSESCQVWTECGEVMSYPGLEGSAADVSL